jgi:hypothetical protein
MIPMEIICRSTTYSKPCYMTCKISELTFNVRHNKSMSLTLISVEHHCQITVRSVGVITPQRTETEVGDGTPEETIMSDV